MSEQPQKPSNAQRWIAPVILVSALLIAVVIITYALVTASRQTADTGNGPAIVEGEAYSGTLYEPPVALQDFTLPASTGTTLSLRADLGADEHWTLLFFGYTHCPDFCPTTLADFRQIKRVLGDDAAKLNFVFVSVDAERDTPEVLARYLKPFDPTFIGLAADTDTLERIKSDYGLYYAVRKNAASPQNPDLYPVDHSTRTYLIDSEGRLRASFAYNTGIDVVTAQIQRVMAAE